MTTAEITAKLATSPRQSFANESAAEQAIAQFFGTLSQSDAGELEGTVHSNEEEFEPPYYVSIGRFLQTPVEILGWL